MAIKHIQVASVVFEKKRGPTKCQKAVVEEVNFFRFLNFRGQDICNTYLVHTRK